LLIESDGENTMITEKERKAILAKLELLDHALKLHNWTAYEGKDAQVQEEIELKIDAEVEKEGE